MTKAIELLKSHDKWVAWKYVTRDGRKTKPPVNPHTGQMARNNKPEDWGTYDQAIARVKKDKLAGVGFVITDDDNLTGIDLDHVRDEKTGKLEPWAEEIIKRQRAKDFHPSQEHIADEIAREFRADGVVGAGGKPLTGAYIKRHALKGISSAQNRQLSTSIRRGK